MSEAGEARRGGLSRAVEAGLAGETATAKGLLDAIGGWRGIVESLLPATVYLVCFVITRDGQLSIIAPVVLSVSAILVHLVRREPVTAAISGLIGVIVCAAAVLLTGEGSSYFVPGFYINAAWIVAYSVSLIVGWPLIGLVLGFLRGSLTEWRRVPVLKHAAQLTSVLWLIVFSARLAVQLPLYFADRAGASGALEALGIARLVMGVPLFALAVLFTWLVLARVSARVGEPESKDISAEEQQANPSSDE